jgi:hypothetical protein
MWAVPIGHIACNELFRWRSGPLALIAAGTRHVEGVKDRVRIATHQLTEVRPAGLVEADELSVEGPRRGKP